MNYFIFKKRKYTKNKHIIYFNNINICKHLFAYRKNSKNLHRFIIEDIYKYLSKAIYFLHNKYFII